MSSKTKKQVPKHLTPSSAKQTPKSHAQKCAVQASPNKRLQTQKNSETVKRRRENDHQLQMQELHRHTYSVQVANRTVEDKLDELDSKTLNNLHDGALIALQVYEIHNLHQQLETQLDGFSMDVEKFEKKLQSAEAEIRTAQDASDKTEAQIVKVNELLAQIGEGVVDFEQSIAELSEVLADCGI